MDRSHTIIQRIEKAALAVVLIASLTGGILFGYITSQIKNFSGINNLKEFQPSLPTKIYDINGELIAELFKEKRELVAYEELPSNLINAFVDTEDKDFYNHFGINPLSILRALVKNIMAGRVVQGGSTITQQLAKRLFTTGERTLMRKALEAILALQIEKKFTKEEILEMYFNQIYLGHGCYGIASAAKLFFNKNVSQLSVAESSILAALPSAPRRYSPLYNTHNAYEKNWDTLSRIVEAGHLGKERAEKIYKEFWPKYVDSIMLEYPTKTALTKSEDKAPYFTDFVRQILISRFGKESVYNEGRLVYTTLDLERQRIAQKLIANALEKQNKISGHTNKFQINYTQIVDQALFGSYDMLRKVFNLPAIHVQSDVEIVYYINMMNQIMDSADALSLFTDMSAVNELLAEFRQLTSKISTTTGVQSALVAVEPKTGYITTMIGGSGFSVANQYNRALQARRQPGSSFKPFVYGAGIEKKIISPDTTLPDAPIVEIDSSGDIWEPGNYDSEYSGMVDLKSALAASINIISVRIYDIIGSDTIIDYASKMLKVDESRFTSSPSLALGVSELTPMEMATAYAIYANRGRDVIPFAIRYITDRDGNELVNIEEDVGNILASKELDGSIQVIPPGTAYIMTQMLRGVVDRGTATESIRYNNGFVKQCAGKTGTTQDWTDAWFCGFTPDIAAVVWVGYDQPFMSLGRGQAGAAVAAPLWAQYMKSIYRNMKDPIFPAPPPNIAYIPEFGGFGEAKKMKSVLDLYMERKGLKTEEKTEP